LSFATGVIEQRFLQLRNRPSPPRFPNVNKAAGSYRAINACWHTSALGTCDVMQCAF
jgi:hypothetical protein